MHKYKRYCGYSVVFCIMVIHYLSFKKAYSNEAEELFAEAQRMAQLRYKTYVRKTQEDWSE